MTPHVHAAGSIGFWSLTVMWFGMMAAMMAPTVWPWVAAFHRFSGTGPSASVAATTQFAGGYLSAWFVYSILAAALQMELHHAGAADDSKAAGVIFLVAGLYQFAVLKAACLTHCRSPLSHFLTRWRNGPAAGFQMGFHHGLFCVGCCWALMATTLAIGTMNLWWMGALAGLALVEQVSPYGHLVRRPLGLAFIAASVLRLAA